jgi:hypothetical protein
MAKYGNAKIKPGSRAISGALSAARYRRRAPGGVRPAARGRRRTSRNYVRSENGVKFVSMS